MVVLSTGNTILTRVGEVGGGGGGGGRPSVHPTLHKVAPSVMPSIDCDVLVFIIYSKEIMFSVVLVCWFVCLLATLLEKL